MSGHGSGGTVTTAVALGLGILIGIAGESFWLGVVSAGLLMVLLGLPRLVLAVIAGILLGGLIPWGDGEC